MRRSSVARKAIACICRGSTPRDGQERVGSTKISTSLACRTFGVGETCYRYGPKLRAENEVIADLLVGLTEAGKTWGGPCFLHLRNVLAIHGTTNGSIRC